MKIQKVKDYNREAIAKWKEAVKNWDYKKGGFPNLCFYTFSTPQGFNRKNGYVISKGNSQHFRLTKKEVESFLTKV